MLSITPDQQAGAWDGPAGAATPRGWFYRDGIPRGFYLDYGREHYRSSHDYCQPGAPCRDCQPGNVLAVRYPAGPDTGRSSRYCETVTAAREYVETGTVTGFTYSSPGARLLQAVTAQCRDRGALVI